MDRTSNVSLSGHGSPFIGPENEQWLPGESYNNIIDNHDID